MAITRHAAVASSGAGVSSLSCTLPSGISAGSVLKGLITQDGSGKTFSLPGGWTVDRTDSITHGDTQTVARFTRVCDGTEGPTVTVSSSASGDMAVIIGGWDGVDNTTTERAASANNPNSSSVPTSPVTLTATTVTAVAGDQLVFMGAVDSNGGGGSYSGPTGYTTVSLTSGFFSTAVMGDEAAAGGATGSVTSVWTSSGAQGNFVAYLIALQPAGSGGGAALASTPNEATAASGALSTAIKLAATAASSAICSAALTTLIALAAAPASSAAAGASLSAPANLLSAPSSSASAAAGLSTAIKMACAGAGSSAATAAMTTAISAHAAASSSSSVAAALTTVIKVASTPAQTSSVAGALTNWATVTLAGTLYTGPDSIVGIDALWSAGAPTVGSTVYYDGAQLTIEPDASLVATSNGFSALAQFFNGTTWSQLLIQISPGFVSYPVSTVAATALLGDSSTAFNVAAAATSTASASISTQIRTAAAPAVQCASVADLTTRIRVSGGPSSATIATASLVTAIKCLAAAAAVSSASATWSDSGAVLASAPATYAVANASLQTQINLQSSAAADASVGASVTTKIQCAANPAASCAAAAMLAGQVVVGDAFKCYAPRWLFKIWRH